jgi:hypothetical protein
MGSWVFSRIADMFEFFRHDRIDPRYWAEKLQSGRNDAKEFSIEALKEQVMGWLDNYDPEEFTAEKRAGVVEEIEMEIFDQYGDTDEHEAIKALFNFKYQLNKDDPRRVLTFDHCEGPYGKRWSYHYIWCLWAIVWGIQQWDAREAT